MMKSTDNGAHSFTEGATYEGEIPQTKNIFKPILFSTEMVQAILAGRKTQTRRVCTPQPSYIPYTDSREGHEKTLKNYIDIGLSNGAITAKYQISDILWVREKIIRTKYGAYWDKKSEIEPTYKCEYLADKFTTYFSWPKERKYLRHGKIVPSIHVFQHECRIFLKVTNVRCERLNDISREDCKSEGIKFVKPHRNTIHYYNYLNKNFMQPSSGRISPSYSFQTLWDSINAKKYPWKSNPFVWVYDFERIEKPENFLP